MTMNSPEILEAPIVARIDKPELVRRLSAVLPREGLLHSAEDLRPYECDGLSAHCQVPLAVALPADGPELSPPT